MPYQGRLQGEPQTAIGDFPGGWPTGSTPTPARRSICSANALHTQRTHADRLVGVKHAAHLLLVKANQPTLHQQLATLPRPVKALPRVDVSLGIIPPAGTRPNIS